MAVKKAVKKTAAKKPTKKAAPKTAKKAVKKKSAGPRLFPTKAELEAMKLAREAGTKKKDDVKKSSGARLFPTKAELEARRQAELGVKTPVAAGKPGRRSEEHTSELQSH